ncbi:hypothetical protein FORC55_3402 [Vibrio cholerae]|nr:hypothetical protein FORC55_3402 [Vibrio cholerae]
MFNKNERIGEDYFNNEICIKKSSCIKIGRIEAYSPLKSAFIFKRYLSHKGER